MRLPAVEAIGTSTVSALLPILSIQIFFFGGFMLLQGRIGRFRLAGKSLRPVSALTGVGLAVTGAAAMLDIDVIGLSWIAALYSAAYFFANLWVLGRKGLPHRKMGWTGLLGGTVLTVLALSGL